MVRTKALYLTLLAGVSSLALAGQAMSDEISIVSGAVGNDLEILRSQLDVWEERSGHTASIVSMPPSTTDQFGQYRLWLASGNSDIDIYRVDVIWAPQLASHFLDLSEAAAEIVDDHFPSIIESQTVDGKLVALPFFTDAPALYYRTDLLEKHGAEVPGTWQELTETAQMIMDAERAEGNDGIYGFVFQGAPYEGLTCDALEWVKSHGGGQIVEPDGEISINNENAVAALEMAAILDRHHRARRRAVLQGRGRARRMADRQCRVHAQLAVCYLARQRRRLRGEGSVRCGAFAGWRRWRWLGGDPGRLEPGRVQVLCKTRMRRSIWRCSWPAPKCRRRMH